jgi:hypothetical protein
VRERRLDEALNPAVSADEAEAIVAMNSGSLRAEVIGSEVAEALELTAPARSEAPGECIKCDSATLDEAIEERFTPFKETVDELIRKQLTGQQLRAIDLILAGVSDSAAAKVLRVHRVTLGRWRRYHPAFVAELNRRRDVDLQSAADRLRGLSQRAISILEERMADSENPESQMRAALALLRLNGIGRIAQRVGETSADDLIENRALANRKTKRGPIDHGEREDVLVDLARRAESAEVEDTTEVESVDGDVRENARVEDVHVSSDSDAAPSDESEQTSDPGAAALCAADERATVSDGADDGRSADGSTTPTPVWSTKRGHPEDSRLSGSEEELEPGEGPRGGAAGLPDSDLVGNSTFGGAIDPIFDTSPATPTLPRSSEIKVSGPVGPIIKGRTP